MKINKKDIFKSTNKAVIEKAKSKQKGSKVEPNIVKYDFSKGVEVTDHFVKRAQERFGLKSLQDLDKTRAYVSSWAKDLLNDYDEINTSDTNVNCLMVRCREIMIVYHRLNNTCITCYPITYNTATKEYDTLKTVIEKKKLKLDDFTKARVTDTFQNIYYTELRQYAKYLADYYTQIGTLYDNVSKTKNNNSVNLKMDNIYQLESLIGDIESKLQNIKQVVMGD